MSKTLSATARPAEFLGVDPVIETDDDLDLVLYELSYLRAVNQSIDARINEQIEAIKQEHEGKKVVFQTVDPDGGTNGLITIDNRLEQLNTVATKYCKANKKKMIQGTKKTKKFPHGSISFNKQRDAVGYQKGVDVEESFEKLDELMKTSLVQTIAAWLKSICLFGKDKEARLLAEVIELKPKYNFTKLKDAYDEERLTDEHLNQLGLKYHKGLDKVIVKPAEYAPR